jgi:hypothetical protein
MNIRTSAPTLAVFALLASFLKGGVIPGRWEKVYVLQPGSKIILTLKAGDRMKCTFKDLDSTSLKVSDAGRELVIPKGSIARIVKENRRSSKPAFIGAGVGALAGAAIGAAPSWNWTFFGEPARSNRTSMAVSCALIGAVVGYAAGYYNTDRPPNQLLYEAPEN